MASGFVPAGMGAKSKFVIRPLKPGGGMDHSSAVAHWEHLRSAFTQIHAQNASALSYEELYRYAYNLVLHKHGELLYEGVCKTIRDHLAEEAAAVRVCPDETLLSRLRRAWEAHRRDMRMIADVLMYMDRTYVPQNRKLLIHDQGTVIFREQLARHPDIRPRMTKLLLDAVADARAQRVVNYELVRSVLQMLVELGISSLSVYQEEFEAPMLRETEESYRVESSEKCATGTCPDYLQYAAARIDQEHALAATMMPAASMNPLMTSVQRMLIAEHAVQLIEMEGSGLVAMLERNAVPDLRRMFHLFALYKPTITWRPPTASSDRQSPPLAVLRESIKHHIQKCGLAIVTDSEQKKDPVAFIQALLDLRDKYAGIVDAAFTGDKDFHRSVKEAFEFIVNYTDTDAAAAAGAPPSTALCAEYLAVYVDENMKAGFRGLTEEEVDERLSKVIALFRFIRDKDVFEAYYKQYLTKRLLGGRVSSDDAEKAMISKLKAECGFQFTSKLEGMFNDLRVSQDFMKQYRRERGAVPGGIDIDVTVLTSGTWPGDVPPACNLPTDVAAAAAHFSTFYLGKHSGRRLVWHTGKGTADVKFLVDGVSKHELVVSTYQMCILLMFNDMPVIPYRTFEARLNIPAEELKRHLLSLAAPKAGKLLLKSNKAKKDIDEEESFEVNTEFSSKMVKVRIPLISIKSVAAAAAAAAAGGAAGAAAAGAAAGGAAEASDVPAHVEEARRHMLDAAIVRIMKARRTIEHNALVAEVMKQVASRFHPMAVDIKKRIENLIEREYLERDETNKNVYTYLA